MYAKRRLAAAVAIACLGIVVSAHGSHPTLAAPGVVGHVYVNDNSTPSNAIAGFDRHADGTLTPIAGSPFADGGTGLTGAVSQSAVALADGGHFLIAANAGSNTISVMRILGNGELHSVEGSPFASHGVSPVSIAISGDRVYVANDGNSSGGANFTGFTLTPPGRLDWLPSSTYTLSAPATIGQILISPDGQHVAATRVDTSVIYSFNVGTLGQLVPAPGSPFAAQGYGPFGSQFRPTNSSELYVSNAHDSGGGPAPGTVSAFSVSAGGTLASIGASPYPDGQIAACWIVMSPDGGFLYVVNTGSGNVSSFSVLADGSLQFISSTVLAGSGLGALDAGIAPDGQTLYVVERGADAVAGLSIANGTTTELASSPAFLPAGANAFGIAVQ